MPGPPVILATPWTLPGPVAVQIGLEAASAPIGKVPAKGSRSTAAPRALMPIPTGGNPGNRKQGAAGGSLHGAPGDADGVMMPSSCLREQQHVRVHYGSATSQCLKQHMGLPFLLLPTELLAPEMPLGLPWTPLFWNPKVIETNWDWWRGLTLGSTALGQLSTLVNELKPHVITLLSLPLLLRELAQNSLLVLFACIKTIQNTVGWRRNTMNCHHIDNAGTVYIVTTSLLRRSNKHPLQSSYCDGWERKRWPERCHILETRPGKKEPQLTRWVRESLGLSKALWLS